MAAAAVQFDEGLARGDRLAVLNADGRDGGGLQGPDDLAVTGRDELAGGDGEDVEVAEAGPGDGGAGEEEEGPEDGPAEGGRRGGLDLQGGGEEFPFLLQVVAREEFFAQQGKAVEGFVQ